MASSGQKLKLPPETELEEEFLCTASGPGGQKINKTASAVRLVYHFPESTFLSEESKERLKTLCGSDTVIILARESRSLQDNREAARVRLSSLLTAACKTLKKRKPTKPTYASKQRRLASKNKKSEIKSGRARIKDY